MAPASWIQRVGAACAALAIAVALLSPPPSHAGAHQKGGPPSREIGGGGSAPVVAGPSTTTRSVESTLVSHRVAIVQQGAKPPAPGFRFVSTGGEAPAVTRWRIAHGTSTSSP